MSTAATKHDDDNSNVIDLHHHPRTWTDPNRVERFLQSKREEGLCVKAAVRFAGAVPPLGDTLPRSWTAPLIASLPEKPILGDLEVSVAGAARYFEYLRAQGALDRLAIQMCEYDLLTAAHIVEEMLYVGLDKKRMALEEQHDAAGKVQQCDKQRACKPGAAIAGDASWLGGWVQLRGTWVVVWVPAGGGVAVASAEVDADERPDALAALYMKAFREAAAAGRAPARLAVFSTAQERAMRDFAREAGIRLFPLYRLRESSPLRFWAEELLLG